MYKITTAQYPLVPFLLFPRPSFGYDLGPSAKAAEKPTAGQFGLLSKLDAFPHELPVLRQAFSSGSSKLQENIIHVHPRIFGLPQDGPMTAKGVVVEFFDGFYDVRTKGIQVYIADQREKVIVFVAEYGFVAVLEQVAAALMAAVVVLGIPGELFSHDGGDAVLAALEKYMNVVIHEDPGINGAFPF